MVGFCCIGIACRRLVVSLLLFFLGRAELVVQFANISWKRLDEDIIKVLAAWEEHRNVVLSPALRKVVRYGTDMLQEIH
jgi:hypothetical protein